MPYDKSRSPVSLRAAWAEGRGQQAEQLRLPRSASRNAGGSLRQGCPGCRVLCCCSGFCFLRAVDAFAGEGKKS